MFGKFRYHIILSFILMLLGTHWSALAATQPAENQALKLAYDQFLLARKSLEKKIKKCEAKRSVLDPALFKSIKLSKKEMEIALSVFNNKAEQNCEKSARGKFVIATGIYRTTATHYNQPAKAVQPYSEELMFGNYWGKLEVESKYMQLDKKQQKLLAKIPELKKPFQLFETLEKLNLK
jgi:hypothetical protein